MDYVSRDKFDLLKQFFFFFIFVLEAFQPLQDYGVIWYL